MKNKYRDIYDDVLDTINDYLNMESFKLSDLENKIRENGSPMRVAPAYTVKDYLNELEIDGVIKYENNWVENELYVRILI